MALENLRSSFLFYYLKHLNLDWALPLSSREAFVDLFMLDAICIGAVGANKKELKLYT